MKATITWKGEEGGPDQIEWFGKTFKKDEAVEVTDERAIEKAKGNQFMTVVVSDVSRSESTPLQVPPSNTVSPQHAAPKPGEPVPSSVTPKK